MDLRVFWALGEGRTKVPHNRDSPVARVTLITWEILNAHSKTLSFAGPGDRDKHIQFHLARTM